ncbi:sodium:dicarboxylate symporter [Novosphingobium aromaticivorans DSM 12444]|uniref:Sodium:dicarboxylate symporter n=1 Tax=Novosphingobium aromaticivorans (strain ATCC 700278 / DSM 12444 / CCUG 56034 / CIP 105152 / NBRC 16084 / F199) TaxID=279238 RepID=Q2GB43_NOVAD|nr:dicarboxylate/amino acid:cation symporter [Novosphingobium aromaticivorans]ABD24930.1 sodium:dicarboxylate symporter [Novosphingobium aromaticivorans DSM 12444]SCY94418.1 Na+/H+-dicarboxylate symporter [Novosphingobium aromaticivorans]
MKQSELATSDQAPAAPPISTIRAGWIFAALVGGLALGLGLAFAAPAALESVLLVVEPIGNLWLQALRGTIVPLVVALLFTGIVQTVAAARAGALARRALLFFASVLAGGCAMAAVLVPAMLAAFPMPQAAADALRQGVAQIHDKADVPGFAAFLQSIVPANVLQSAASDQILPVILFTSVFALAATRLTDVQRRTLATFFEATANAMLVVIGWVLLAAPVGVFCLSLAVAAHSGTAAIGALAHYVLVVTAAGVVVFLAAYAVAVVAARQPFGRFARAMLPAQALALSTQSSLATLPAMLGVCRTLGVRAQTADLVLPLAVALFRATGPAMNLAVAIYVAHWFGMELTPSMLVAGFAVATLTTLGAVSLPGAISFVTSIGPIAIAMGVPVEPLALLVAVEVLPDLMRTLGNVTMDVAVTAAVDRAHGPGE